MDARAMDHGRCMACGLSERLVALRLCCFRYADRACGVEFSGLVFCARGITSCVKHKIKLRAVAVRHVSSYY